MNQFWVIPIVHWSRRFAAAAPTYPHPAGLQTYPHLPWWTKTNISEERENLLSTTQVSNLSLINVYRDSELVTTCRFEHCWHTSHNWRRCLRNSETSLTVLCVTRAELRNAPNVPPSPIAGWSASGQTGRGTRGYVFPSWSRTWGRREEDSWRQRNSKLVTSS